MVRSDHFGEIRKDLVEETVPFFVCRYNQIGTILPPSMEIHTLRISSDSTLVEMTIKCIDDYYRLRLDIFFYPTECIGNVRRFTHYFIPTEIR